MPPCRLCSPQFWLLRSLPLGAPERAKAASFARINAADTTWSDNRRDFGHAENRQRSPRRYHYCSIFDNLVQNASQKSCGSTREPAHSCNYVRRDRRPTYRNHRPWRPITLFGPLPNARRGSCESLREVSDEIVGMLNSDRHADQGRRNSDFAASFLGEAGMYLSSSDGKLATPCRRG